MITIIALVVERVGVEGNGASDGVSSSEEFASVSMGVGVAVSEKEFLCVEGPEIGGVLSLSMDPRSRTCSSTAGCFPIFSFGLFFPLPLQFPSPVYNFEQDSSRDQGVPRTVNKKSEM